MEGKFMIIGLKAYYSLFRIRFIHNLQYRMAVLGAIAKGALWVMMEALAYRALYRANPGTFPMDFSRMVSYIWVRQSFIVLFRVVFADGEIYSAIRSGEVAYDLVRPVDLYGRWFCQSASNRLSFALVNCLPVLLLGMIIPRPFRLTLPRSALQPALFMLSALLAFGVTVAMAMLMYISLFYLISQRGIRIIVTAVTDFFSGGVIPLPFFPEQVLRVVRVLPFAAMQNMPLQIFCGNVVGADAVKGIMFQMFWLTVLVVVGRAAMRIATKRVIVQGG